jgi:stage III sporulation protein SpoIIIAA
MTDTGIMCDVIGYAEKKVAFEAGIRAMRPDIIITDEITFDDISIIKKAIGSGVATIASAHLRSFEEVLEMKMDIFDEYAVLSEKEIGRLRYVYDKKGKMIYKDGD